LNEKPESPKLLAEPEEVKVRRQQLSEPHVAPLRDFVELIRKEAPGADVPDFDPWDGGIKAQILFLLEAPGPKARYGFVSRDNPDETAANFFHLNRNAGIPRDRTACWNVVPWFIGKNTAEQHTKIRPAKPEDIQRGAPYLLKLIAHFPNLKAVVFLGKKSASMSEHLRRNFPMLKFFEAPHPSPMFCNRRLNNPQKIQQVFCEVAEFLRSSGKL
jgi:uracil-DNA glycosylase